MQQHRPGCSDFHHALLACCDQPTTSAPVAMILRRWLILPALAANLMLQLWLGCSDLPHALLACGPQPTWDIVAYVVLAGRLVLPASSTRFCESTAAWFWPSSFAIMQDTHSLTPTRSGSESKACQACRGMPTCLVAICAGELTQHRIRHCRLHLQRLLRFRRDVFAAVPAR